jgi:hypothetical protein
MSPLGVTVGLCGAAGVERVLEELAHSLECGGFAVLEAVEREICGR